jgi:hypothetical protein
MSDARWTFPVSRHPGVTNPSPAWSVGASSDCNPREAMRAEIEAGGDPARRVMIVRFERPEAERERLGTSAAMASAAGGVTVEAVAAVGSIVMVPVAAEAEPARTARTAVTDAASAAGAADGTNTPAGGTAPAAKTAAPVPTVASPTAGSVPPAASPSAASRSSGAAAPSSTALPPGTSLRVVVTCGTPTGHIRVQDCFDPRPAVAMTIIGADRTRRIGVTDLLRLGPSGREGLSFELKAPVEIRARNAGDQRLLTLRLLDAASGRLLAEQQAPPGGTILLRR